MAQAISSNRARAVEFRAIDFFLNIDFAFADFVRFFLEKEMMENPFLKWSGRPFW